MTQLDKKLKAMKDNPQNDWHIEDLKAIAKRYNIEWRQPGTSHITFVSKHGERCTVPSRKPLRAIYVKDFIEFIDSMLKIN